MIYVIKVHIHNGEILILILESKYNLQPIDLVFGGVSYVIFVRYFVIYAIVYEIVIILYSLDIFYLVFLYKYICLKVQMDTFKYPFKNSFFDERSLTINVSLGF